MFFTLKTYNFNDVQHKFTYHKNVLIQERHELSMQVFHGTKKKIPYWSQDVIHSESIP